MTRAGLEALEKELEELKTVRRKDVAEKIKVARGFGDLSENSEYDEAKSVSNAEKHGIDFEEAQELWDTPYVVSPLEHKGERRYVVIGRIFGTCWTAVVTNRGSKIRIISVRRSTRKEASYYDRQRNRDNP